MIVENSNSETTAEATLFNPSLTGFGKAFVDFDKEI
jgi:hypothetical protein